MNRPLAYRYGRRHGDFPPSSAPNAPAHDRAFTAGQLEEEPIVYLVDDDAVTRMALESLLASDGRRVEAFSSGMAFLERVRPESPACIVMDIRLPDATGLEVQEELARRDIHTPIIFLTGYATVPASVRAMKAGAADFLSKPVDENALMEAVHAALKSDRRAEMERRRVRVLRDRFAALSHREREVMLLVVRGRLNKQIAHEMDITEKTVKAHRGKVMKKMKACSFAELVRMAGSLSLTEPDQSPFAR
jgi:FixJ family two-component response regulator